MDSFARRPALDRRQVIQERATQMDVDFTIVEKDFWVCWTLKSLFALPGDQPKLIFKGGTSLSKAYGIIDRFSEDIDVVTDPQFFIDRGVADPEDHDITESQREKRMARLDAACVEYIDERLQLLLRAQIAERLGGDQGWDLLLDPGDPNTLLFHYPKSDPSRAYGYLRDTVKIELGWRAKSAPSELRTIEPYLADIRMLLDESQLVCTVLSPDRTFWEKVTALHAESFRDKPKQFFSRHYSDVAAMLRTRIGLEASRDLSMLDDVRVFKSIYYHAAWAHYDLAVPGSLVIVPGSSRIRELEADYRDMQQMFLHEPPSFATVIGQLAEFEAKINGSGAGLA